MDETEQGPHQVAPECHRAITPPLNAISQSEAGETEGGWDPTKEATRQKDDGDIIGGSYHPRQRPHGLAGAGGGLACIEAQARVEERVLQSSRIASAKRASAMTEKVGTYRYMAPEVLRPRTHPRTHTHTHPHSPTLPPTHNNLTEMAKR